MHADTLSLIFPTIRYVVDLANTAQWSTKLPMFSKMLFIHSVTRHTVNYYFHLYAPTKAQTKLLHQYHYGFY